MQCRESLRLQIKDSIKQQLHGNSDKEVNYNKLYVQVFYYICLQTVMIYIKLQQYACITLHNQNIEVFITSIYMYGCALQKISPLNSYVLLQKFINLPDGSPSTAKTSKLSRILCLGRTMIYQLQDLLASPRTGPS